MMCPRVSVIVPIYNRAQYIERALKSIFGQTIKDLEIIVVDGGSTDNSIEIIKSIKDKRIKLISQSGIGVSSARNEGIRFSKSDLIAFLDADDEWMPNHLENILKIREKYDYAGAYVSAYDINTTNGIIRKPNYERIPPYPWEGIIPNYFASSAYGDPPIWTSSVCIPKKIFYEVGFFMEGIPLGEDLEMWFRIALKYPIAFTRKKGATYHMEASNRACNNNRNNYNEEPLVILGKQFISKGELQEKFLNDIHEYIIKKELERANRLIIGGYNGAGFKVLVNCKTKYHLIAKYKLLILALLPKKLLKLLFSLDIYSYI